MCLLVVLMCRLFLKWCALQRLPQLARQRTCILAMVAKDGGCCAGCRRCRFSTSYDAILNANLHPHDGSLCLLMSCLVQTFFFFHFLGNCLVRLFFSRIDSQSQYRKVMAFMSFPYGTRMPCSCVAYVV